MLFQGDWSLYVEQLTLAQVQSQVMEVLCAMYPNITVPQPVDIYFPTWASDKLFRGSYSNWGPSYVPTHSENLKATLDHLWFAGEATSVQWFGASFVQLCSIVCAHALSTQVSYKVPTLKAKMLVPRLLHVSKERGVANALTLRSRRMRRRIRVF